MDAGKLFVALESDYFVCRELVYICECVCRGERKLRWWIRFLRVSQGEGMYIVGFRIKGCHFLERALG